MSVLEEGQIQIHTENIFPIIKKAVYSGHEVFLRELVSNAVDAINKRRMAAIAGDCIEGAEGIIKIAIDREKNSIKITDNGIGMTLEEVKKYINQVAFSSAEEFLEKYKQDSDGIIGHFGLGFYSSFMVAKKVDIFTKSAKDDSIPVHWSCDGSPSFSLKDCERDEPGTDIVLELLEEEQEYIEPSRIKTLIRKYCDFMPIEVQLEGETINRRNPLWRKNPNEISDEDYKELYSYLYPFQGEPLLWIHLKTDYPYSLQGILYFPRHTGRADWEKGEISLYCNQVFVSDSIKEVVPRYLLPLRGVIDSPDIPLNVSRSALQTDRKVRSIGNFVSKKVADRLRILKTDEPNLFTEAWESLAPFVKIGAMEDEKFAQQVSDLIVFKTLISNSDLNKDNLFRNENGETYTTLKEYLNRSKDNCKKRVLYCTDEISQSTALNLWRSQEEEVILVDSVIDSQFIPWLESQNEDVSFQRVDSELDDSLNVDSPELTSEDGETKTEQLHKLVKTVLNNDKVTIQVKALKGKDTPPAVILLPEQMRRINDIGALMEQKLPGLPENHVLLINSLHPLVVGMLKLRTGSIIVGGSTESKSESLANDIARHLYDMARISVGGMDPSELPEFQTRNAKLMGQLLEKGL